MTIKDVNLFIITSITLLFTISLNAYQLPRYERYINQITKKFAEETEKEFRISYTGNSGRMPYDIQEVGAYFTAYRKGSIEEARELEVKIMKKLAKAINSDEKIRPYLRNFPFKETDCHIHVSFLKKNGSPYADGSVEYVFYGRGKLHYYRYETPMDQRQTKLLEEPYDDAIKILRNTLRLSSEEIH